MIYTHPVLKYPFRSPLNIVEGLKDIIKDKVVCDVGCACGDILFEFSKYAKKVIGIECDKERADITKERGFEVVDNLPEADVYYVWIGMDSFDFLEQFKNKRGKLVLAQEDRKKELGGYEIKIPIEEISTINDRKFFYLQIIEL